MASLPGVKKEDINIDIHDNVLTISGKKESEREEKEANYYLKESSYGSFSRSVRLPGEVEEEDVDASYKDGVLKVVMKAKEGTGRRKIEIKS
ncbi:MAG: Hsp20/alpha crystallin family protein [Deltaproteobacteria bacterium]|nr:Hsp20/alpha crystallin family protein [Deltaproteobacteria bacterium]